ncbi:MAG TPA: hypothetical protein VHN98_00750, partial [Acidimicrobiales bacterium]|nr:hypothetical protein [Acidimicrobiales bacterium]
MNRAPLRAAALAASLAITAAACGGSKSAGTPSALPRDAAAAAEAMPASSGASTLRAGLTSLLQEHVYLAGITTG